MPAVSRIDDPTHAFAHRRAVLQVLLWFTGIFGGLFAILNFRNASYGLMSGYAPHLRVRHGYRGRCTNYRIR